MRNKTIGVASIATNNYLEFYFNLVTSFERNCPEFSEITFYIFTDRSDEANAFAKKNGFFNLVVVKIPNHGWPEASLLRYEIFDTNREIFDTDVLVYLDSDMLILRNPIEHFRAANSRMTFIRHPGFYFEFSISFLQFVIKNPRKIFSMFLGFVKFGGIGAWETDKDSSAYVKRLNRKRYFCGGIWFARKSTFLNFCNLLSKKTIQAIRNDSIPIWHDESYLNWFAAEEKHNELNPLFCSDEIVDSLFKDRPYVRAVNKQVYGFSER